MNKVRSKRKKINVNYNERCNSNEIKNKKKKSDTIYSNDLKYKYNNIDNEDKNNNNYLNNNGINNNNNIYVDNNNNHHHHIHVNNGINNYNNKNSNNLIKIKNNENSMDIFVKKSDNDPTLIKLKSIEIKNLKEGFKYIGYRCRVVVSRKKKKELSNFPNSFNWVEGIIKYWDPKFKMFFIHFLLAPNSNFNINDSIDKKYEWKYLMTQDNSLPAETNLNNLILSPYAIDRGWFNANPITLKYYDNKLIKCKNSDLNKFQVNIETNQNVCTRCENDIIDNLFKMCSFCNRRFHLNCLTLNKPTIEDLKDDNIISLRKYYNLTETDLINIANEYNQYLKERKKKLKYNNLMNDSENNLENKLNYINNKKLQNNSIINNLIDIEEIEKIIPNEVKNIILENYNSSYKNIRKLLTKLPNNIGNIINDYQIKLLCRNYRYNKRSNSISLINNEDKDKNNLSDKIIPVEMKPIKIDIQNENINNNKNIDIENNELIKNYQDNNLNNINGIDNVVNDTNNIDNDLINNQNNNINHKETELYICKDCMKCIYCNQSLLKEIPIILKHNELPNRNLLYNQIPTKMENFVICSTCCISYHGSCGNPFIPPLIFGGDYFNCSNCCKCTHCGYRDNGPIDYSLWDSKFTICSKCSKGFEKGQFCSICRKIWTSTWEGEWLQCDICKFWIHYNCDKDLNKPIEYYSNNHHLYNCPVCRSDNNHVKYQRILDYFISIDKNKDFNFVPPPTYQNYWKVVKLPMDITTIHKNLNNQIYDYDKYLFMKDIFRIIYNAQISHMPNHRIYKLATNIFKKICNLYKLLFNQESLNEIFQIILKNEQDSSMYILYDIINHENIINKNEFKNLINYKNNQISDYYSNDQIKLYYSESNFEEYLLKLFDNIFNDVQFQFNFENNYQFNQIISNHLNLILLNNSNFNYYINQIISNYQNCQYCNNKYGQLILCKICNKGTHYECCQDILKENYYCNICSKCNYCNKYMINLNIPILNCCNCNKKAHYTCVWKEYEKSYKNSEFDLKLKENYIFNYLINNYNDIKDNKDYLCIWKLYSSYISSNQSKVIINSPLTAIFGKGYYQYLNNEIYLCKECYNIQVYKRKNIILLKYIDNYNLFIKNKIIKFINIFKKIINNSDNQNNQIISKKNIIHYKILNILINNYLQDFEFDNDINIIICNICSKMFKCNEFEDLKDIAFEKDLCTLSFNFICKECIKIQDNKQELLNLNQKNMDNIFSIINNLISVSQFRIIFSKDIYLILKLILNPLVDLMIKEILKLNSKIDINIDNIKNDIFKKYLRSNFFKKITNNINKSSLIQWYLYYIQEDYLDISLLKKDYLKYFYKENIKFKFNELIKNNTLLVILNSIEKMVLSNNINNTEFSLNEINQEEFLLFLNYYKNILFYSEGNHLIRLNNINKLNYEAFIDTKMFFDINNSFKEYLLNNFKEKDNINKKDNKLKLEIMEGLSLIKDEIKKNDYNIFKFKDSIFTKIYSILFKYFDKYDEINNLNNIEYRCYYCKNTVNFLLGEYLIKINDKIGIHKECILWSIPFVLEPILNSIEMGYESKFELNKKKNNIYLQKYPTFENISWPLIRKPIFVNLNDIIITLSDMKILKCFICNNIGATIKCSGNDSCLKYFHLNCIFKNYIDLLLDNEDNNMDNNNNNNNEYVNNTINNNINNETNMNYNINNNNIKFYIRIKYRRIWCDDCWHDYKNIIEPEPHLTEGLTGGILNIFIKMISINLRIVENNFNNKFIFENIKLDKLENNDSLKDFIESLINILKNIKKKNSKIKLLIKFLNNIDYDLIKLNKLNTPFIINNSMILLDPGIINSQLNISYNEFKNEVFFFPKDYKLIRVWKSSIIINKVFDIKDNFTTYLCSINELNNSIEFQIDWIPNEDQINKIMEILKDVNIKDEFLININIKSEKLQLFRIPLLKNTNIEKLYINFNKFIQINDFNKIDRYISDDLIIPELIRKLFVKKNLNLENLEGLKIEEVKIDDNSEYSQIFFGLKEEVIYNYNNLNKDKFYLSKLISGIYYSNLINILDPELWCNHRHYPFNFEMKYKSLEFEYSNLGKHECKNIKINKELFSVLYNDKNYDSENVEIMNVFYKQNSDSIRKKLIKLDDMAPSMLYRYLDSLPYDKRLTIKKSNIHGYGLFAKEIIKPGEPIIEYVGELIRNSVADKRENIYKSDGNRDGSCYMFRLDQFSVIDATNIGNHARFMNHCCDPNSVCKVINVDSNKHIIIFSKKLINKDEEITYDYQFNVEEASEKIACHCGASNCLGRMN